MANSNASGGCNVGTSHNPTKMDASLPFKILVLDITGQTTVQPHPVCKRTGKNQARRR
jgi:hypothetical protein